MTFKRTFANLKFCELLVKYQIDGHVCGVFNFLKALDVIVNISIHLTDISRLSMPFFCTICKVKLSFSSIKLELT